MIRNKVILCVFFFLFLLVEFRPEGLLQKTYANTDPLSRYAIKTQKIRRTGDVLYLALPATALAMTYHKKDAAGRDMFLKSCVLNFLISGTLKVLINKPRPDGGKYSFPSFHTSSAFQAASFIGQRYGHQVALLPYALAGFTGYSRIRAKRHDFSDVLGGLTLGNMAATYYTRKY
eukprot:COSAG01_NODE_10266_length_2205_cov_28.589844_2_plen_175_part_00